MIAPFVVMDSGFALRAPRNDRDQPTLRRPYSLKKGAGYAFIPCPFAKKGDGAPIGATFSQCTHLAMRGAFRRAIAAS